MNTARPQAGLSGALLGALLFLLPLVAGCSAGGDNPGTSPDDSSNITQATTEPRGSAKGQDLRVEEIASGSFRYGPASPRVVVSTLSYARAKGRLRASDIPSSVKGTYLSVWWGEKPSGGYSLAVESARLVGEKVTVRLSLKEVPTTGDSNADPAYPYVFGAVQGLNPRGKHFYVVQDDGEGHKWPVRRVPDSAAERATWGNSDDPAAGAMNVGAFSPVERRRLVERVNDPSLHDLPEADPEQLRYCLWATSEQPALE